MLEFDKGADGCNEVRRGKRVCSVKKEVFTKLDVKVINGGRACQASFVTKENRR